MSVPRVLGVAAVGLALAAPLGARDRAELSSQPPTAGDAPTLKVYSRETWVDVTVTDEDGNPVHGLTRDDFTILEDNQPMKPTSFAEHRTDLDESAAPLAVKEALPPNTFTNVEAARSSGPINILLFDSSNTPALTQRALQSQMLDYVDRLPTGSRVAVLRMTYHLLILQGVTTDHELVRAAIASDKVVPGDFALQDADQGDGNLPFNILPDDPQAKEKPELRGEYYVTIMKQLARFLSGMPGRKNLIWFTGLAPEGAFHGAFKSEVDLLARSHVAVFPIDPRNPASKPSWAKRAEDVAMEDMADQTGGRFYGAHDLAGAVGKILDSGANYYALTYIPTEKAAISGQFRNITVKVNRPGLTLNYRPGYYATDPTSSLNNMKLPPQPTAMQGAMLRGGLEPTQILFQVKLDPSAATTDKMPADNEPGKKMKAPYWSIRVSYSIDINSIAFRHDGDAYRADFEFGTMVYNDDGDLVNTASMHVRPVMPEAAYLAMLKEGAKAYQTVEVPAEGNYYLRIGVHDVTTDHVGALEVPTSDIAAAR